MDPSTAHTNEATRWVAGTFYVRDLGGGGGWGHTMAPRMHMVRERIGDLFTPERPRLWMPEGLVTA